MEELITLAILLILLAFSGGLAWIIAKIINTIYDLKAKKHRAKYPHLYELYEMRDHLHSKKHSIRTAKYYNPKNEIDNIMKNMRYFPKAKREEMYVELEQLRMIIANHYAEIRPIEDEIDRIETQIEDYKKLHKIKKVY